MVKVGHQDLVGAQGIRVDVDQAAFDDGRALALLDPVGTVRPLDGVELHAVLW